MTRELYGMFHELSGNGQAAKEVRMLGAAKGEMRCGHYEVRFNWNCLWCIRFADPLDLAVPRRPLLFS